MRKLILASVAALAVVSVAQAQVIWPGTPAPGATLGANTFTGTQTLPASTTAAAPLNIPQGTAPTAPNNGDCWTTSAGLYCQINGATVGPFTASGGNVPGNLTLTNPASPATFTLLGGKTATINNTLTFAGTDATTMTFPATSASVARTDAAQTFTGNQTFSTAILGGSGMQLLLNTIKVAQATSPTLSTGCNGTSSVIATGGSMAGIITPGTSPGTTCSITMPFTPGAGHGWICTFQDVTNPLIVGNETAGDSNTNVVTVTWYNRGATTTVAPASTDHLTFICFGS